MAMTDRPTGMLGDVPGFLRNYQSDLEYQYGQDGIDYVNSHTNGTPWFKTDAEFELYWSQLKTTIKMLEDNK
jgi:hypothetical protein